MHSTKGYAGRVLIVYSVPANLIGHHSILKWDSLIEVSPKVNDALAANKALAINPKRVVSTLALRGQYGVVTGKTPVGLSRLSPHRARGDNELGHFYSYQHYETFQFTFGKSSSSN
uniref:Uncharacterized protein n=1 Tax=Glossina austeni TaxID=7395 RepID=A0A1A9V5G7_GLOAU